MTLEILTPEKSLYNGEVESITLPGTDGSFQILNNHAPIIAALAAGKITVNTGKDSEEFEISNGFVECLKNHVVVLVKS